jgi:hypothetical protein
MKIYKFASKSKIGLATWKLLENSNITIIISFISWVLILVVTAPFISYPIEFGLDPSWIYFINKYNYFLNSNPYIFGLDVFFTYGPLGFILYPNNGYPTYLISIIIQLSFWSLFGMLLFKVINQNKCQRFKYFILLFSLISLFSNNSNIFILVLLFIVILLITDSSKHFHYLLIGLMTACIMFYVKFNVGILYSSILFSLYLLLVATKKWEINSKYTIAYLLFFFVVLPIIYLIYSPSLKGLYQHFYYSAEISKGYSVAMSRSNLEALLPISLLYILLYLIILIYLYKNGEETFLAGLILIPGLFFSFKSGFVRQDIYHYSDFYNFYLISILFLLIRKTRLLGILGGTLIVISLSTGIIFYRESLLSLPMNSIVSSTNRIIIVPQELRELNNYESIEMLDVDLDTNIKQIIGNNEVIVIPHNLLLAPYNGLQLSPLPILQNYVAFTDKLDKLNADFIEKNKRNQFILFEFESIDGRNPFTDTPLLWQSILRWYDVRYYTDKFLLLERLNESKDNQLTKIQTVYASKNDEIYIPGNDNQVIAKVYMNYSTFGQIKQFFYQTPPVIMKLSKESGEIYYVRVIPSTLRNGIFINYFPTTLEESYQLFELKLVNQTAFIQFIGEGTRYIDTVLQIDFYEIQND